MAKAKGHCEIFKPCMECSPKAAFLSDHWYNLFIVVKTLFSFFLFLVSLIIMCLDTLKGIGDQRGCVNLLISACYQTLKSCCLLLTSNSLQYRKEKTKFIWKFFSLFKVIIGRLSFFFLESFFSLIFHQVVICLPRSFFFNLKKILTWKFTYMVLSIN